ncbi:ferrochelatase [Deltaproteobacteria bacterium]|nr:ferrochelatase [Deltaproteobacteria bacterium]
MKTAVIIMNLGTPVQPTKKAVRAFLKEFLMDRRVVEIPRPIWWLILYGIILPFRTPRVTRAYQKIWQDGESPLRLITRRQSEKLQLLIDQNTAGNTTAVTHAMSYSGPDLESVINGFCSQGFDNFLVLPLYPQYSATTTGGIYDQYAQLIGKKRNIPRLTIIKDYHDNPDYIEALAQSVTRQWQQTGQPDVLLMSFHGIPQRYVDLGDPYYQQCSQTAELLAKKLQLADDQWQLSFQSRLGRASWLSPYTSVVLEKMGKEHVKHVDVICPAFAADCLETLEEIADENKEIFLESGGEKFHLVSCLNDHDSHIEMMAKLLAPYLPPQD